MKKSYAIEYFERKRAFMRTTIHARQRGLKKHIENLQDLGHLVIKVELLPNDKIDKINRGATRR